MSTACGGEGVYLCARQVPYDQPLISLLPISYKDQLLDLDLSAQTFGRSKMSLTDWEGLVRVGGKVRVQLLRCIVHTCTPISNWRTNQQHSTGRVIVLILICGQRGGPDYPPRT